MSELTDNRSVEDAAIARVLAFEEVQGRHPRDARGTSSPVDIESSSRMIEVKAFGITCRGQEPWLEPAQFELASHLDGTFFLYVVENVRQGNPDLFTLKVLGVEQLESMVERAKEHRYYTLPWPTADYDSCPSEF